MNTFKQKMSLNIAILPFIYPIWIMFFIISANFSVKWYDNVILESTPHWFEPPLQKKKLWCIQNDFEQPLDENHSKATTLIWFTLFKLNSICSFILDLCLLISPLTTIGYQLCFPLCWNKYIFELHFRKWRPLLL